MQLNHLVFVFVVENFFKKIFQFLFNLLFLSIQRFIYCIEKVVLEIRFILAFFHNYLLLHVLDYLDFVLYFIRQSYQQEMSFFLSKKGYQLKKLVLFFLIKAMILICYVYMGPSLISCREVKCNTVVAACVHTAFVHDPQVCTFQRYDQFFTM